MVLVWVWTTLQDVVDESRDSRGDRTLAGQIKSTDSETVGDWKNDVLLQEITEYDPCGIYSSDETSLCFSIQPAKSLTFLENCVVVNIPSNSFYSCTDLLLL